MKSGYLLKASKKGVKKSWKPRWFEITTDTLRCLEFEGNKVKFRIKIADIVEVKETADSKRPFVLYIKLADSSSLLLAIYSNEN